jgi:hypothetical protein
MATPRQPVSRVSVGMFLFALVAAIPVCIFFVRREYFAGAGILAIVAVGSVIYFLGMSSGLPGTSGRDGRNVKP